MAVSDTLLVQGRRLRKTPVYESYWRFAFERQSVFFRRQRGDLVLTLDPIISRHRFTNAYRASDRVSQYLITRVAAKSNKTSEDVFFRTLLFKIFNKINTWERLERALGPLHVHDVNWADLDRALESLRLEEPIYSGAYIMPSPALGAQPKHTNHLRLLQSILQGDTVRRWERSKSLAHVYEALLNVPSFGPFLAFQFTIDLNYSAVNPHPEEDFVVAGPGARNGIAKCFTGGSDVAPEAVIDAVCTKQREEFAERGIAFQTLWGRDLQPIDCQNLFCEVDKYARIAHPEYSAMTGRTRIKQVYRAASSPIQPYRFPKHWGIDASRIPDVPLAI